MTRVAPFTWHEDGERLIAFGRGRAAEAGELLGEGYVLLTTARAREAAPELTRLAAQVVEVPAGRVDTIAGELAGAVSRPRDGGLVALGGGRVIDVAKALASAWAEEGDERWTRQVAAVPTTLSAAQMSGVHRRAEGRGGPAVRPRIVLDDPALSGSQPATQLAASALNALGHAYEAPLTPAANPITTTVAETAARLLIGAWDAVDPGAAQRDALSLGALLAGWAMDVTGYGLHHVMAQTLVRYAGVGHGPANAVLLPHSTRALERRFPERLEHLGAALREDPASAAAALCERTGATRLRDVGVTEPQLAECAHRAAQRPELAQTPPPADRAELLALYQAAW